MYQFPKQNIPENEKNEKWMMECVDAICHFFDLNFWKKNRDILCYEILEGIISEKRFEYITKEFGKNYPAKLKNYPLIRPIIDTALGEEIEQNYRYNVVRIDEDGLDYKQRLLNYNVTKIIIDKILAGEIKNPIDEKYVKELTLTLSNDLLTEVEIIASKLAKYYEYHLSLKEKSNKLFASILEVGKCFWKVEVERLGADPSIRVIPSYAIEYADEDVENIADATWIVEKTYMSVEEILDLYGNELSKEAIEYIQNYNITYSYDSLDYRLSLFEDREALNKMRDEGYAGFYRNYFNSSYNKKIEVYRGQWKSIKEITLVELGNEKNRNANFYKLFDDNYLPKIKNKKNVVSKDKRYIQELYEFVRIGSGRIGITNENIYRSLYVRIGKSPIQIRSIDNPYYVKAHYNGFIFSKDSNNYPFSLVWYLRDLQELYNILNYHRERMIALSGVKGIIYDISQIPKGYTIQDILYYKKLGLVPILNTENSTYNQFGSYNDSLDASISVITQMLEDIRIEVDRISGFNRQRQGQMFQKDLVGQIEKAIKQGAYATAVLYYHQDKVYKTLLESLINFAKYVYKLNNNYKTLSYIIGDRRQEIFKITEDFVLSDFGIYFTSSGNENAKLEQIKAAVQALSQQGQVKITDAIRILQLDSTAEIESKLLAKMEEQEKMLMEMQQKQAQQPNEELQFKIQSLQAKMEMEKMKLQHLKEIKLLELQAEAEREKAKVATDKEKNEIDRKYKEGILKLKEQLINLEREEFISAVEKDKYDVNIENRKEIKNIV